MEFKEAFNWAKQGKRITLPSFKGYWYWDAEAKSLMIVTKEGEILDIRESPDMDFTLSFIFSDQWSFFEGTFTPKYDVTIEFSESPNGSVRNHLKEWAELKLSEDTYEKSEELKAHARNALLGLTKTSVCGEGARIRDHIFNHLEEFEDMDLHGVSHNEIVSAFTNMIADEVVKSVIEHDAKIKTSCNNNLTDLTTHIFTHMVNTATVKSSQLKQEGVTIHDFFETVVPSDLAERIESFMIKEILEAPIFKTQT